LQIPITKPFFDARERELMLKPLDSGWVVQGPYVREFETEMAEFVGSRYAIAMNSCTSCQFILSRVLNLRPGDEVIIPAFTWISTANAVEYLGAEAVFCDIDIETFNIDASLVEDKITRDTRAIYPVHLFGLSADMPKIMDLANSYGLEVMEDAACGLGGKIGKTHCGTFGRAGVFSFHPRKSITTGEGGMLVTDDAEVAKMAASLRDHGAIRTDYERHHGKGSFLLTQYPQMGINARMTDIQGAMGVAQMEKLDWICERKRVLAKEYNERLNEIGWLKAPIVPKGYTHGYQAYCCLFKPEEAMVAIAKRDKQAIDSLHKERNGVMANLEERGIATRQGTHAVHIQQLYRERYCIAAMDYPAAYAADRLTMALPFFPTIEENEREYLFQTLKGVY
jgi:perosamine synthetase